MSVGVYIVYFTVSSCLSFFMPYGGVLLHALLQGLFRLALAGDSNRGKDSF